VLAFYFAEKQPQKRVSFLRLSVFSEYVNGTGSV